MSARNAGSRVHASTHEPAFLAYPDSRPADNERRPPRLPRKLHLERMEPSQTEADIPRNTLLPLRLRRPLSHGEIMAGGGFSWEGRG